MNNAELGAALAALEAYAGNDGWVFYKNPGGYQVRLRAAIVHRPTLVEAMLAAIEEDKKQAAQLDADLNNSTPTS